MPGLRRRLAGLDRVRTVVDAPRDLNEGAVIFLAAHVHAEHDATASASSANTVGASRTCREN